MECYVQAQGATSWSLLVRWGRLGLVQAGYVRSFSRRPVMILTLSERQSAVTRHVWGARLVTWCLGGLWLLLLVTSWRVLKVKWYYYGGDQIWSEANYFYAEIGCWGIIFNWELFYLKIFWLEWHGGVVQYSVVWSVQLSSEILNCFQKNQLGALIVGWHGYNSKDSWIWSLLDDDLAFRGFLERNFPTFSVRGDKLKYFGKLLVNLIEFHTCKGFFYLSLFLDI